ncbi:MULTISPECIES: helix-turn-helix domain-containing protein [Comamonas]|jgi:cytoskeleton protein RodZ|uniref:helix-turn-helix domain-containing protein n=1 Tax=Comamonas TaxID=283 RepID=UPI0025F00CA5|nr:MULTISPECIES: helix-turn-helix domain-containing protein [Comamonas]MDR3064589.1 helix-turn-helix domain-containing protein [Comamonas sp.]MEB5964280.1 helix-turn-helix domain-containing protein [Comamonas testosteroni]
MSEAAVEEETMQSEEQAPTPAQTTAGALLRQAREAARMQLPVMAATLKVPQRKLEALEADDYAAFPDHVFMRALAMGMCRTLHIEADPVLALLPRTEIKSLANTGPGINQAVKVRSSFKVTGTSLDSGNSSSRKIAAGVLILLAAAAAVYFVPFHQVIDGTDAAGTQVQVPAPLESGEAAVVAAPAAMPATQANETAQGGSAAPAAAASEPAAVAAAGVTGDAAAATPAAPATAAAVPQAATPAADVASPASGAAGLLVLKANAGQSWVKVKDGTGKVVLEKTLSKDESATAEGPLPLSVIVGNAKGTQVTVRGEPFDISSTRDNVARFEVK